jgi:hypothetical protein
MKNKTRYLRSWRDVVRIIIGSTWMIPFICIHVVLTILEYITMFFNFIAKGIDFVHHKICSIGYWNK